MCSMPMDGPWLCYWIVHPLALLNEVLDDNLEDDIVDFLARCQDKDGGYGGGPGQLPHLATTYAALNTLVTIGSEKALLSINRDNLHKFMLRVKDTSGAFRMHEGCQLALTSGTGKRCWGLHSKVVLLGNPMLKFMGWVAFRQGLECGFQGRTNKLVDGCYSFWQGATVALTQKLMTIVVKQLKSSYSCKRPSGEDACGARSSGQTLENSSTEQPNRPTVPQHCPAAIHSALCIAASFSNVLPGDIPGDRAPPRRPPSWRPPSSLILLPYNYRDHWMLVCIYTYKQHCIYLDSMYYNTEVFRSDRLTDKGVGEVCFDRWACMER
ncbi:protein farnesyltransferase subunit beta-like [Phragmites australis]|uniref:protein farnesyltransferase subunit beta-like n=1 Tax=Phragmites australis TaxID=29695 RepID=UPI002D78A69C|nr:protein farnesyltransferase subunit beta-like [Phragmites australis]